MVGDDRSAFDKVVDYTGFSHRGISEKDDLIRFQVRG